MDENPYAAPQAQELQEKDPLATRNFTDVFQEECIEMFRLCGVTSENPNQVVRRYIFTRVIDESEYHPSIKRLNTQQKRKLLEFMLQRIQTECGATPKALSFRMITAAKAKLRSILHQEDGPAQISQPRRMLFDSLFNEFVAQEKIGVPIRKPVPEPFLTPGTRIKVGSQNCTITYPFLRSEFSGHIQLALKEGYFHISDVNDFVVLDDRTIELQWKKPDGSVDSTTLLTLAE